MLLLSSLALAACGTRTAATRPSHAANQSPLPSSLGASPPEAASPTATTKSAGLHCRLPLLRVNPDGTSGPAGFITFPEATFSADHRANAKSQAYDRAYDRWLPVDWRAVSSDGSHYAYAVFPSANPDPGVSSVIHVVDVSSGADRVILSQGQYIVTDYEAGGVYLSAWIGGHDGPGPQVGWVLNPVTGALHSLSGGQKYGHWIGGGAGWRADYDPADPTVHQGMTGANRIIRIDLVTGNETPWFYQQGADNVAIAGFDRQGVPIITSVIGTTDTLWSVPTARGGKQLFASQNYFFAATADTNGLWVSDGKAIFFYDVASGLRQVSSIGGAIEGGCH